VTGLSSRTGVHREHLLLGAVVALGWGTVLTFGAYDAVALAGLLVSVVLMVLVAAARGNSAGTLAWVSAVAITAAGAFRYAPRLDLPAETPFAAVLVAAAAGAVVIRPWRARLAAVAVAVAALLGMTTVAWRWGTADIDVFYVMQHATAAVLSGQNPYVTMLAAPSASGVSALHHQFPYLPGAALLAAPARLLGDVRLMSVIAFVALIAFVVRLASESPGGRARALKVLALCLALPTTVAMVHWAWVDVYSVTGLAGWLALRRQHWRWSLALLAMGLTIKPTILIALVPALLWSRRARREILIAAAIAAVLMLPFVLATGLSAFYQDVIGIQVGLGFRTDGLTLSGFSYQLTGHPVPLAISLVAGALVTYVALRRRPVDLADNLTAAALLSTAAFLLSRGAFLNFYFIPLWLLVLAIAGQGVAFDPESDVRLPLIDRVILGKHWANRRLRHARSGP
jgi:hypothetical protein